MSSTAVRRIRQLITTTVAPDVRAELQKRAKDADLPLGRIIDQVVRQTSRPADPVPSEGTL